MMPARYMHGGGPYYQAEIKAILRAKQLGIISKQTRWNSLKAESTRCVHGGVYHETVVWKPYYIGYKQWEHRLFTYCPNEHMYWYADGQVVGDGLENTNKYP